MKNSQLKTQWTASWKLNDLKFYKVNWKAIYDLLYVFYLNFDSMMYRFWDIS